MVGLNKGLLAELKEYYFLPVLLGIVIGLAVALFIRIYDFFGTVFMLGVEWNKLFIMLWPIVALLSGYLVVRLVVKSGETGCGVDVMLERYHCAWGFVSLRETLGRTLASLVTIGFGGSAGLEGPSLLLGGGISSSITRRLGVSREEVKKLFLCGAAAGFSAVFKAPLTGILLALEIPYKRDIEVEVFIPASIASVTAYFVSATILGVEPLFKSPFPTATTPLILIHAAILGAVVSLSALAFIKSFDAMSIARKRLTGKYPMPALVACAGLLLGAIGFFYPEVLGLGYGFIHGITSPDPPQYSLAVLALIVVLKILATSITLGFGGSGGLFIPALYVGGAVGLIYAQLLNLMPSAVYVAMAMAAMVAATSKSLLTSVVLVAETVGPGLIVPSMISASISYFLTWGESFYKNQITTRELRGDIISVCLDYYRRATAG